MALVVTFPDIDVDDVEVRFDDGLGGGIVKVTIERPARATP